MLAKAEYNNICRKLLLLVLFSNDIEKKPRRVYYINEIEFECINFMAIEKLDHHHEAFFNEKRFR